MRWLIAGLYMWGVIKIASAQSPAPMRLDVCPDNYYGFPQEDGPTLVCGCSPETLKRSLGISGANPYARNSSICHAALHAGVIDKQGGQVLVTPESNTLFPGVDRNGVRSSNWEPGNGFMVSGPQGTPVPHVTRTAMGVTIDVCPWANYQIPLDTPPITCGCTPDAMKANQSVSGANPYAQPSSYCRAALHAGVLNKQGGQIMVTQVEKSIYPGVTRNGVQSGNWEPGRGFRVDAVPGSASPSVQAVEKSPTAITMDVCPWANYQIPLDSPPIICGCTPDAMKNSHSIYGANPYAQPSSYCLAALHAGVLNKQGGQVMVTQVEKSIYPGVTRNGVQSGNWEPGRGFHVDAAPGSAPPSPPQQQAFATPPAALPQPPPGVDSSGRPIQAPIEQTLRTVGHVQVYINFVTDSAQLLPSSDPVLSELLKTLMQNPGLQIDLIGHTDSTGTAPHNQELSERRAASVYLWLVQHGISRERLRSSGRGFLEPIATNDTLEGRALNRRVEVSALR